MMEEENSCVGPSRHFKTPVSATIPIFQHFLSRTQGELLFVFSFFYQHLVKQRLNIGLVLRYPFTARKSPCNLQISHGYS